jgi:hypothetical protein
MRGDCGAAALKKRLDANGKIYTHFPVANAKTCIWREKIPTHFTEESNPE